MVFLGSFYGKITFRILQINLACMSFRSYELSQLWTIPLMDMLDMTCWSFKGKTVSNLREVMIILFLDNAICNFFYIAPKLYDTLQHFTLKLLPRTPSAARHISALSLGDVHLSEPERLDNPCARATIRFSCSRQLWPLG